VFRKIVIAGIAAFALGLVPAGPALAADSAGATLMENSQIPTHDCERIDPEAEPGDLGECLAEFAFFPEGERLLVTDRNRNGWGVLVELWWGGKLRRWCWNTKGYDTAQECNFKIKDGRNIRFFIVEFHKRVWDDCRPSKGCGKRQHFWAGPFDRSGCAVARENEPCGDANLPDGSSGPDFLGEA
jgi:hypothetical protein